MMNKIPSITYYKIFHCEVIIKVFLAFSASNFGELFHGVKRKFLLFEKHFVQQPLVYCVPFLKYLEKNFLEGDLSNRFLKTG